MHDIIGLLGTEKQQRETTQQAFQSLQAQMGNFNVEMQFFSDTVPFFWMNCLPDLKASGCTVTTLFKQ